jgi:MFS family permease
MIPFGSVVFAASTLFFALEHSALWEAFVAAGMAGIGIGFTFAAMPGFIIQAVPATETGSAMGLYQVLRSIGLSLGSALASAVLISYTKSGRTYPTYEGFRVTLIIATALCATTAVLSFVLPGTSARTPIAPSSELKELMQAEAAAEGAGLMLSEDRLDTETNPAGE